ncbi:thiamine-binding protein [Nesterenkonia sp. CF4.4]|uniref:thiamine-binding protein n=1 Tax=Nesterenkonia sp. CF4.4 TaxID=3373079 RepID=UPI003EE7F786
MLAAFSVAPVAPDTPDGSLSAAVAEAVRVVRDSGLPHETTSMFTTIEGDWDEVFDVIRRATEAVAAVSPRVSLVVKADIRPGFTDQLTENVTRLEERLSED